MPLMTFAKCTPRSKKRIIFKAARYSDLLKIFNILG